MVALGVASEACVADKEAKVPTPLQRSLKEDRSLRDTALWFPDIPPSNWHLNEDCFIGKDTPTSEFRPLYYTLFGGPGGTRLRFLRRVSVFYLATCIKAIDFHYSTSDTQRLGHLQLLGPEKILNLDIHGPQGETIENIDVDVDLQFANHEGAASFWKHGRLRSFKVSKQYLRIRTPIYALPTLICPLK